MLAEHPHRRETARVELAGAQHQAVIQVRPDAVLLHVAGVGSHGFGSRRGESHIDPALVHQAENRLDILPHVGVAESGQGFRVPAGELRVAEAFHLRMPGEANKVLVRIDDHYEAKRIPTSAFS